MANKEDPAICGVFSYIKFTARKKQKPMQILLHNVNQKG